MNCKNCNQTLEEKSNYCPLCGQKNISKLNIKFVLGEFFQTMFNVDSKLFITLKYLVFKPGFLTKEYISGKRVSYLPPIRIYLVLSFIFFFLISVFDNTSESGLDFSNNNNNTDEGIVGSYFNLTAGNDGATFTLSGEDVVISLDELKRMQYEGTLEKGLDSLTAEMPGFDGYVSRKLAMSELDGKGFMDVLRDQFSLFLILFFPFFALLYSTIFSGTKRGLVGHLIFNLHLNSFIIFALLIDLTFSSIIGYNEVANIIWGIINVLYIQYYLIKAVMVFYQRKFWNALYKYVFLLFGYGILALVFLLVVFFSSIIIL